MAYKVEDKIEWTMIFILEFAKRHKIPLKKSFEYLQKFNGIKFLDEHYNYVHTQSFDAMVDDVTEYCQRKGGAIISGRSVL